MKLMYLLLITLFLIIFGCKNTNLSKDNVSDIVCEKPYIRFATTCCLDQNNNSICDNDEKEKELKEERSNDCIDVIDENGFSHQDCNFEAVVETRIYDKTKGATINGIFYSSDQLYVLKDNVVDLFPFSDKETSDVDNINENILEQGMGQDSNKNPCEGIKELSYTHIFKQPMFNRDKIYKIACLDGKLFATKFIQKIKYEVELNQEEDSNNITYKENQEELPQVTYN